MRHLDLYSGIGGFALAAQRVGWRTVAFCEIDDYCQRVLRHRWNGVMIYDDVRTLSGERIFQDMHGELPDVITGGFPCQDISSAGAGDGIHGERSGLWKHFARLIREIRPEYAVVENTAALTTRGLDAVIGDLAEIGYDAEWHGLPAARFGAPHRRERVWIVAYPSTPGLPHPERRSRPQAGRRQIVTPEVARRWASEWLPEPEVGRVVHGLSVDVDAVAALGNAVVPQAAEAILQAIESEFSGDSDAL